jgi:hypothetical protein
MCLNICWGGLLRRKEEIRMKLVKKLVQVIPVVVALLVLAVVSHAMPIKPVSYDMPNGCGKSVGGEYNYWDTYYTGSGEKTTDGAQLTHGLGKLTDGIIATNSWEWTFGGVGYTLQDASGNGPYIGWTWGDPTITFHFADKVNIDNVTFYVDDPGNDIYGNPHRGGVAAPKEFIINGSTHSYTNSSPGSGPLAINIDNLGLVNFNDLTVKINRDLSSKYSFWLFVSEITFDDGLPAPVPEPSTFILFGAGIAGFALLRNRHRK